MEDLKKTIIADVTKECKDIDELVSYLKWVLEKAKRLQDSQTNKGA